MTHSDDIKGMFLSIDLCPSTRLFESDFFRILLTVANERNKKFPIAIAISGLWISNHPEEFNWLINNKKSLDITWVNHSFNHPYFRDKPLNENFLLSPRVNIKTEILMTEKLLLQHNQVPSIFFRFPGLVSNKITVKELNNLGLIPIGSNAWLAKGEQPKSGSIVLIHGNGNEPAGIKIASKLINRNINWLPLNYALSGSE
ncbi:polysaccharide deacetylase family protein [Arsenophonus sp. ENCA]|uniref:polysaccharide deacetylase family protein n=1 Tax=Arsenophonus sp. ENCA TaxID=1987579 RepID=UPI0025B8498B|nr:polysaccharide deacetylase family protein [Arsenophonus sp. ENCA]